MTHEYISPDLNFVRIVEISSDCDRVAVVRAKIRVDMIIS